ncbi:MAG: hypothetical protein J7L88_05765, partial [Thermoplasmata archaeon]|nr:hypothetical protein [Thermoplasmata archaeon]
FSLDPHRWTSASGTAKDIMNSLRDMDPNNVYIRFYLDTDYYSPPTWENNLEVISTTGERDRWYLRNYTAGFEDAPSWARILHEELCWLYDITDWWVDHRMKENGYLGGGWTDDVEFIGLFGFNALISRGADNKSLEGARRFVEGMLQDGGVDMERGFSAAFADAEHSAELTGDSLPMMIAVDFGNPRWLEFSMKTAVLMRDLWMGVNEKGFLQFKSNYLSATKIGIDGRAEDSWINYRATLPARWVWWYSSNKDVEALFLKWAENWVQAALSTEKGKPYGVIPADIGWPDGEVGGHNAPTWYKAAHPPGTVNYDWEPQKYKGYIVDLLVSAYEATGNLTYLEPLRLEAELANEWKRSGVSDPAVGSRLWAGKVLYTKGAVETYQKILNKYGLPGSDPNPILWTKGEVYRACIKGYNYIRKCYPLMTTEASATDRVAFVGIINPFLIYTGGSVGGALLAPSYTYTGLGRDFAAMVKYANRSAGEILLYGFFDGNRNAGLIPWDLQKGATYRLTGGPDLDGDGEMDTIEQDRIFTFSSRGMVVNFTLPGRREYILKIEKMEGADELSVLLPDPAWGDEEVIVNAMNNSVDITLHNVGSADCGRFNVTLVNDNDGEIVAREVISYLSAPRNLQPSIFNFSLKLLREEHYPANYTLIINPGGTLQEITPFNNIKKVNLDLTSLEPLPQNRAPTGPARINITLKAGENYLFSLPFSDPDGDQLIVEVLNNTAWMEISHNLTLTFSPPCNLSGVFYVTLNISDGNGSYLLSTLIITVKPPLPPSLSLPDNITLMERESASFNISTGVDYPCNFSIRISNYRWAVLRNGTLTICPIDGDAGKYVLTVEAYLNENIHSVYNITVVILKNWTDFKYHIAVEPLLKIYYINSSVNFSVSWSGYNGPLKFYWILLYDNNTVFNISKRNITVHLTREGVYSMILYLEDYGVLYSQNLNVTERPSPTGEKVGEKEKKGNWVLYVVGLLLGIAIIVIAIYIGKRIGQNIEEE